MQKNQKYVEMTLRGDKRKPLVEEDAYQFSEIGSESETKSSRSSRSHSKKKHMKINYSTIKSNLKKVAENQRKKKFSWSVYKKLLSYSLKQWKLFLISMITLLVTSLFTSSIPYATGLLLGKISEAQLPEEEQTITMSYLTMLLFLIGLCVSNYIQMITTSIFQERIGIHLRLDVFGSFLTNDIHFFEIYKSGELNSRVGNDINEAKSAAGNKIADLIRSIITTIANICIIMFMSWKLGLLILMLLPLYALVTTIHNNRTKVLRREYQDVQAEASVHLNEVFTGIQVVKAFSTEQKEINKYDAIQTKSYTINYIKALFMAFYFSMSDLLPNVGILMVLWYGGDIVISGKGGMSAVQLTAFIMYCTMLQHEANQISGGFNDIVNGTSAIDKVFEMMNYEPYVDEKEKKKFPDYKLGGEVEFKNVDFQYPKGEVLILRNLNLRIKPGEYVAFVGQSGSGKSTIVKLIERFYQIHSGELTFDGINSKEMNIKNIRQQIGFVSQQAVLFSGTIEENIVYGTEDYSFEDMIDACKQSGCLEFINNEKLFPLGFKTNVGEKGGQLSGGQKQRISIARALMKKPKILIFDQATSALDSNSEYVVQKSIQNLVATQTNTTIIVIAHRLSTIIAAHKIYVMKGGEIIESGNHQNLLNNNGYYAELMSKQLQNPNGHDSQSSISSSYDNRSL